MEWGYLCVKDIVDVDDDDDDDDDESSGKKVGNIFGNKHNQQQFFADFVLVVCSLLVV